MLLHFYKYHGTGNDFILIDNRNKSVTLSTEQISHLCNRRFGIGADGLMLLENADGFDFRMVYYNADGNESTMCGNGGRCITAFARQLEVITNEATFIAIDGAHYATIEANGDVSLQMQDVHEILNGDGYIQLNTGSPHYVKFTKDVLSINVVNEGRCIRNMECYQPNGINVNFVQHTDESIYVRTYERGVEDETLSCGTGVTAAAIAVHADDSDGKYCIHIITPGGQLAVSYVKIGTAFTNIILNGPARYVYEGRVVLT
jgi:diaminopimelate epimerase